ncbi:MAG: hypothetical protein ABFE07_04270 [Armatimonadia bacterium]
MTRGISRAAWAELQYAPGVEWNDGAEAENWDVLGYPVEAAQRRADGGGRKMDG